jgi:hypothetical protein
MRLTGIDNDVCSIDLYVFGPSRAESAQFRMERCAKLTADPLNIGPGSLPMRHPELATLVGSNSVATRLTGRLTRSQMKEDASISWSPFQPKLNTFYSASGAMNLAANYTVPLLVMGLLLAYSVGQGRTDWRRKVFSSGLILAVAAPIASDILIPRKMSETPGEGTRPTRAVVIVGRVPSPGELGSSYFHAAMISKHGIRKSEPGWPYTCFCQRQR